MSDKKPAMITMLIDDWKQKSAEAKERLKLKYLPFEPTSELIEQAGAFLSLSDADRSHRLETSYNEEAEFLIAIETARALYRDPADRNPGSITEDKVARYPDRYGWKP
jgi:hypothetical protein